MNWLDRMLSWVAPKAALGRVRARKLVELAAALSYEGVRSSRRQGGWNATGSSGNAEISVATSTLRANARDLCRNNAYARKAKREWAKRVVGYGIKPRPDTGSKSLNDLIVNRYNKWVAVGCSDQRINFYAAQKMIVSSAFETGEVLVRLHDRRPEDGLPIPLQIQVLEGDYLDNDKSQQLKDGWIINGIEFDPLGRVRGYWLYNSHPGDIVTTSLKGSLRSSFVPAKYILHHLEFDRPGDARAITRLAAVIAKLRDIDEYSDAEIVRKKIEACLTMFVGQPEGADGPTLAAAAVDATTGLKVEEMRPAMIMYGQPGTKPEFFAPTPSGDYSQYKKTELREVAAGLEIPYVVLDDNLEAVNYSSYRGGLLAFRDAIEEYRYNWLIPQVLDPIYQRIIDKLYVMGELPEPNYAVQWDPPPFDLLDREAEAKADRMELQIGKKTWPQLIGEMGNDPEAQVAEIAKWRPALEAAGVTFASSTSDSGESNVKTEGNDNAGNKTAND